MTTEAETSNGDTVLDPAERCPCGSGDVFGSCCGPLLAGASAAPTAERLMRSRYSAFALGRPAYLLDTWHPSTRPSRLDPDPGLMWRRLVIVDREAGGPFDDRGVVEFEAHWVHDGERGRLHERSRFVREDRRWLYVDGAVR
ncbi:YchJ family metal-binding protein [uncultured Microbacterium sp.]|uniref:YchJ family protein n=1 Tax=uncultured Microbacterium sp. TaxID=191216 RepID=UPI0028DBAD36|nr:YchJ family metal-binding protein [uncultured Microbacterium sp.]